MAARCWIGACVACAVCVGAPPAVAVTLPDGRGYELASAGTDKDVMADTGRTRAASGEVSGLPMAAVFSSLGGFGDVHGTGVATEYVAQRSGRPGTIGWTVQGITPPQEPLSLIASGQSMDPLYEIFSPDLTRGVFRAWSPLDDTANVADVSNLYMRDDVRVPGSGSFQLLSDAVTPQPPQTGGTVRPWIAGVSRDFEHVVFESRLNLAADATGGNIKLYKSDDGIVRLVLANSACAGQSGANGAAPCAMAGNGATPVGGGAAHYTLRVVSADGRRVNFTSPFGTTLTTIPSTRLGVVSKLFQLDDRGTISTDDDAVVQVSMSEKASPDEAQGAVYETGSTDGRRVFFRSAEQLTDTPGSGLYMWERQPMNERQALVIDASGGSFTLTAHTQPSQGSGTLTNGSTDVTGVTGSFTIGQTISGIGIDPGTTVTAVGTFANAGQRRITMSAPATIDGVQDLSANIEQTTDLLPWNATAAQAQSALESLSILGSGNVVASGGPGASAPYAIEFTGALGGVGVMELTASPSGLTGGASTAMVTTTNDVANLTLIGDGATGVLGAAEDGHRVYFASGDDVTMWQDADGTPGGSLFHVATLPPGDLRFQVTGPTVFWNASRQPLSRVTPDGRTLLFESSDGAGLASGYQHGDCAGNATGSNNPLCAEAYVYRADSSSRDDPDIVCASCNLEVPGAPGDTFLNARKGGGASLTTAHLNRALTDDGHRVFFDTTEALDPDDTNGTVDVYEYDVQSGEAHLISSGTDAADSYFMDASADGSDVFFVTRAQLVGWDTDQAYDLYDARVGGGFPEPVPTADCSGDACQGQAPVAPGVAALGSSAFRGLGDIRPRLYRRAAAVKCRRGRVKRRVHGKVRCVKRRHPARRHERALQRRADR